MNTQHWSPNKKAKKQIREKLIELGMKSNFSKIEGGTLKV